MIYDFDGTITKSKVPKYGVLEKCMDTSLFSSKDIIKEAKKKGGNLYETFYSMYFALIKKAGLKINNENLSLGASEITYNDGIEEYFENIGKLHKNYIVSSGVKVFLKNTKVAKYFKDIYATTFTYKNGEVNGFDYMMTNEKKVDAIRKIMEKEGEKDCQNIIYSGDGLTDYQAMEYVKNNGGETILITDKNDEKLINSMEKVVSFNFKNDYSKERDLYKHIEKKS